MSSASRGSQVAAATMSSSDRPSFVAHLLTFHRRRGTPISSPPVLLGRPLDVHALYLLVQYRGGFHNVQESSTWRDVAACLVPEGHIDLAASILPTLYFRLLLPFEHVVDQARPHRTRLVLVPPTVSPSPDFSSSSDPGVSLLSSHPSPHTTSTSLAPSRTPSPFAPMTFHNSLSDALTSTALLQPRVFVAAQSADLFLSQQQPHERHDPLASAQRPAADPARVSDSDSDSDSDERRVAALTDGTLALIFRHIGARGDVRDLGRLCLVCRRFRDVILTHQFAAADAACPADLLITSGPSSLLALCRPAATNGVLSAQYCLAFLLVLGWGGAKRDEPAAFHWASLAAAGGSPFAADLAAAIKRQIQRREPSFTASPS